MFAVISDGSRQFRVQEGDTLSVDYRAEVQKGDSITFERVLLANGGGKSAIGQPDIEGATVQAEVVIPEEKGPKLEIQKIRRRKNSRRHTGHRQKYTAVRITGISVPGLEIVETSSTSTEETSSVPEEQPEAKENSVSTVEAEPETAAEPSSDAPANEGDE